MAHRPSESDYSLANDGLKYRQVVRDGVTYSVPKNINAIPIGWQLRLSRVKAKSVSKAFSVGVQPTRGKSAALTSGEWLHAGRKKALQNAIAELKRYYRKEGYLKPDQAKANTSKACIKSNYGKIKGVSVAVIFPKERSRETTPYIRMSATMRRCQAEFKRTYVDSYQANVFKISESEFNSQVVRAVTQRLIMEGCYVKGEAFKRRSIDFMSLLEKTMLIDGFDLSGYSMEKVLEKALSQLDISDTYYAEVDEVYFTVKREGIYLAKKEGSHAMKAWVQFSRYKDIMNAHRVASLYAYHIKHYRPRIAPPIKTATKTANTGKDCEKLNKKAFVRTGMPGVDGNWRHNTNKTRAEFVTVYHCPATGNKITHAYSFKKYGFKKAFELALYKFYSYTGQRLTSRKSEEYYGQMLDTIEEKMPVIIKNIYQLHGFFRSHNYEKERKKIDVMAAKASAANIVQQPLRKIANRLINEQQIGG